MATFRASRRLLWLVSLPFFGVGCGDELELFRQRPHSTEFGSGGSGGVNASTGGTSAAGGGASTLGGATGVGGEEPTGPQGNLALDLRISFDARSANQPLQVREIKYHYPTGTILPTVSWVGETTIKTTSNVAGSQPVLMHDLDIATYWEAPPSVEPAEIETVFGLPILMPVSITFDLSNPDTAHPTSFHIDVNDSTGWWEALRVEGIEIWDDPEDSSAREADIRTFDLRPVEEWIPAQ